MIADGQAWRSYAPALAGTWAATGAMSVGRCSHTVSLLANGQVLVAGGHNYTATPNLSSAELYNPTSGTWTLTGSMSTARTEHTGTLLPNGNVLVAGGVATGSLIFSAELYNPTTGTWGMTGSMLLPRNWATAILLPATVTFTNG